MQGAIFLQKFTVLDFAFLCPRNGVQGESFFVSAEVNGALDHTGFVMDFSQVKKALKEGVDQGLDHRLAVARGTRGLELRENGSHLDVRREGQLAYSCPAEAVAILEADAVTPESVIAYLEPRIRAMLPPSVSGLRLTLEEELVDGPRFRYTHGLRFHGGNCQRLIHGHRNRLEVFSAGRRMPAWEQDLARWAQDAHFASAETLKTPLPLEERSPAGETAMVSYRSSQGVFTAELPANRVIAIAQEPSAENLAALAVRRLKRSHPGDPVEVRFYEGIHKGAVARG
ncbi:MAG: 6-carboxytetrahydropterin synthase [Bdellovibrionales bacterium]|nr:6-carboxytetrahydropterin synthase [Bdellovibrionales bacterium]